MVNIHDFRTDNFAAYDAIPSAPTYTPKGEVRDAYKTFAQEGASAEKTASKIADSFSKGTMERKLQHEANQRISLGANSESFLTRMGAKVKECGEKAFNFIKSHKKETAIAAAVVAAGGILAGVLVHNSKKAKKAGNVDAKA